MIEHAIVELHIPYNALVLLVGPAASGKSTFCAMHFSPPQVVSSDYCRALICDDAGDQSVNREAFWLVHEIVELRLRHDKLAVVDATNLKEDDRDLFYRLARYYEKPVGHILFDVPIDVLVQRNAHRVRQVPDDVLQRHRATMRETAIDLLCQSERGHHDPCAPQGCVWGRITDTTTAIRVVIDPAKETSDAV